MAAVLRVFLVGSTTSDLEALRSRVTRDTLLQIVGSALRRDMDAGRTLVPEQVDAILATPAAATASAAGAVRDERSETRRPELIETLTPREHDVLALLADGYGNRTIAARLGISEHTVKFHLASIFGKLGTSTRTEAVRRGLQLGLIEI